MRSRTIFVCLLLAAVVAGWSLFLRDTLTAPRAVTNGPDAELAAALARPARLSADGRTLAEVLIELEKTYGVDVVFDRKALGDEDLEDVLTHEVHCRVSGIRLDSLIHMLMRQTRRCVAAVPRGSRIRLTTESEAAGPALLVGRVYPLPPELLEAVGVNEEALAALCASFCEPDSWEDAGGYGTMNVLPGALAIEHRCDVHVWIGELLDAVGRMQAESSGPAPRYVGLAPFAPCDAVRRIIEQVRPIHFDRVPLDRAMDRLSREIGIPILLDRRELGYVGLPLDVPIDADFTKVRFGSALERILRPLDITWHARDGVIWITTIEESERGLSSRLYPVGDLRTPWAGIDDALLELIQDNIAPADWRAVGGRGSIALCGNVLAVSQTAEEHNAIERLLRELRRCWDPTLPDPPPTTADKLRADLERSLDGPASLRCENMPLADVIDYLRDEYEVDIRIDKWPFKNVELDTPVTCDAVQQPLRRVLATVLEPLELRTVASGDRLSVTTV